MSIARPCRGARPRSPSRAHALISRSCSFIVGMALASCSLASATAAPHSMASLATAIPAAPALDVAPRRAHDVGIEVETAPVTTPAPGFESCAPPEPAGRWAGRASDDEWARGLYPAHERYPKGWLALTFDDGPHPSRTPRALHMLARTQMHATFFLTGFAIKASTYHLVQRMVEQGHTLANHGWRHDVGMTRQRGDIDALEDYIESELQLTQIRVDLAMMAEDADDFTAMDRRVFEGLRRWHSRERQLEAMPSLLERHRAVLEERGFSEGERPVALRWIRPPGGIPYMGRRTNDERETFARVVNRMGLSVVMWNGGTGDSDPRLDAEERMDVERIARTARKAARRGGIYVAHDRLATPGMKAMINALAASDAEVVTLEQIQRAKHQARGWCENDASSVTLATATVLD